MSSPSSPPKPRSPSWVDDDRARVEASRTSSLVLEEGTLLAGKYRLARTAGFGGMAQLWVATNEATGAEVCIKILVPENSDDDSVERFRREAHAAARLSHRAIVRIFDLVELGPEGEMAAGKTPAALAIVMELLRGETLGDVLMKRGKLPLGDAIDLALPMLSALAHAHRAGVVHRDVKPDNIFLANDPDGHVIPKVLDFGISKMTSPNARQLTFDGVMLGTPSYMSPEQARGARDVDARSDVFSAGILMYMMLAGKNPFESESFHSIVTAILQHTPPRLPADEVPDAVWAVIERALAKDAKDRYADATELGIALRKATGRTTPSDSGLFQNAKPVDGERVVPLGGDSIVTVPPVGNAELGDEPGERSERAAAGSPAARQRAVKIVAAVVGAALLMLVAALLRGPSSESSGAAAAGTATNARPAAPASAPTAEVQTAVTPPSEPGAAAAPAAPAEPAAETPLTPDPVHDAGTAPTVGEKKRENAVPGSAPGTRPRGGASAVPGVLREPAIVRDPGF